MNKPQIKIDSIQVNIKLPEQLHVVRPHSHIRQKSHHEQQIAEIKQQPNGAESQQLKSTPHKIRHIQSIDDKGQFIDENKHIRVSQSDQVRETITRNMHPETQLQTNETELQKIVQQATCEQGNSKPLRHLNIQNVQDKDEFNLRNSREKEKQRKRRLSQSNIEGYIESNNHFSVVEYLNQHNKQVPERIIQEEAEVDKKDKACLSPVSRGRRKSVHTVHRHRSNGGVNQDIERMIVDELDKKKKIKNQQQIEQEISQNTMESIRQEKQQDDLVNTYKLQEAREKMEQQIESLAKVVGSEIGPQSGRHLALDKQESIKEDAIEQ